MYANNILSDIISDEVDIIKILPFSEGDTVDYTLKNNRITSDNDEADIF